MSSHHFNLSYGYRALPPGPRTILFISEPLESRPEENPYDSYNEKRILDHVIYAVENISKDDSWTVIIAVHPEQSKDDFNYLTWWSGRSKIIVSTKIIDFLFPIADLVVGMGCQEMIRAALAYRPVISIQPRLKNPDKLVTNGLGASFPVYRIIDLGDAIEEVMYSTKTRRRLYDGCNLLLKKMQIV